MKSNNAPPRRPSIAPSLSLITPSSSSSSPRTSTSKRSSISSSSSKSPGSSPRTPLLLSTSEPSTLRLSDDDPSLDMDFELLFLHDDVAANSTTNRMKPTRAKSIFTEEQQHHIYSSRYTISSSNLPPPPNTSTNPATPHRPPPTTVTQRRDWSTFNFSHYASPPAVKHITTNNTVTSEAGYGYAGAGAVGVRGKGHIAEMYTRNRAEMRRR